MTNTEGELPPHILEIIRRGQAEGVTFSIDHRRQHRVSAIHWRRGERTVPNALAEAIIANVHGPMDLELDGHRYVIGPVHEDR